MQRLPEAELDVMLALWDADKTPVPRTYFDMKLEYKNWTVNSINSFLTRLEDKGFIKSIREGKSKYYSAVIMRDRYLAHESKGILKKLYKGSLKNFMLSVTESNGIDEADIDELRQYLDELKGHTLKEDRKK